MISVSERDVTGWTVKRSSKEISNQHVKDNPSESLTLFLDQSKLGTENLEKKLEFTATFAHLCDNNSQDDSTFLKDSLILLTKELYLNFEEIESLLFRLEENNQKFRIPDLFYN